MRKSLLVSGVLVCLMLAMGSYAFADIDWQTMQPMNKARHSLATCTLDGKIYAVGGHRGYGGYLNEAEVYDPIANQWSLLPNMQVARTYGTCQAYGGKVYVFGGKPGGTEDTATVEAYDPTTQIWTYKAPMPFNRCDSASVLLNDEIYVIGGETYGGGGYPRGAIDRVDIYNPNTDTWRLGVNLPEARSGAKAIVLNNMIYVIGGNSGAFFPKPLTIFDPQTGIWTSGPELQTPRYWSGAAVLNGKIYVFGGYAPEPPYALNSIEAFDPATNQWQYDDSTLTSVRTRVSAVNLNNAFYLIGGAENETGSVLSLVEKGVVLNQPPVAQCRSVTVDANSSCNAPASIDKGSYDPDGDSITLTQSPAGPYPKGNTLVTLTVTDSEGTSGSCNETVTVLDKTPPSITAPAAAAAYTGLGSTSCGTVVSDITLGMATANDNCPVITVTRNGVPSGNFFPVGTTTITYMAKDLAGNATTSTQAVTVTDNTPPPITGVSASPSVLWPPNHKMVNVTVNYTSTDNCSSQPTCTISDVTSNEPINSSDYNIVDARHVKLNAERLGSGNGRIYTIAIACTDASGNPSTQAATVTVPHDQGKN